MGDTVVYHPGAVSLQQAAEEITVARSKVPDKGEFVVDMDGAGECDSAMICLLLDVLRVSNKRQSKMRVVNAAPQLQKLIHLYQLQDILPVN